ncbi:hypothetical protein [Clostridium tarantellae]|uniref:TATA-box binding n=1 Tax=Clostridium tarantellae TaxID=39493 RepID=A0A6I1MIN1_9CLOT|nr:hypothetical protein [Clostridium tarantellae]MPQ42543.1 hypothetical protein [Clostridium tarantellae]
MKKLILMFIFLIIFSLIICQSNIYNEVDVYKNIEVNLCDIEEKGIRLEYTSKKSINEIITIINNSLIVENICFGKEYIKNNESYIFQNLKEKKNLKLIINKEKSGFRVIIEIIDEEGIIDINKVKNLLEKLADDTITDKRYFTYIKGKLKNDKGYENNINELFNTIGRTYIKNTETIPINSGITGTINLKDEDKFNYSIISYTTDTYLIIGSPVIFTTY